MRGCARIGRGLADNGLMLIITLLALVATVVVAGFVLVAKRCQPKAQATYNEHSVPTADDIAEALAERLALEAALFPKIQPSAAELAERQALDAAVRQELEQCADEELELLADLRIMFSSDCPPETLARSTTQQRIAQELLDERAGCAARYQPGTVAKPAAPAEWRSSTMLTPEELESLRQG